MRITNIDQVNIGDFVYDADCYKREYHRTKVIDGETWTNTYQGWRYRVYKYKVVGRSKTVNEGKSYDEEQQVLYVNNSGETVISYHADNQVRPSIALKSPFSSGYGMRDLDKSNLFTTEESAMNWIKEQLDDKTLRSEEATS